MGHPVGFNRYKLYNHGYWFYIVVVCINVCNMNKNLIHFIEIRYKINKWSLKREREQNNNLCNVRPFEARLLKNKYLTA